ELGDVLPRHGWSRRRPEIEDGGGDDLGRLLRGLRARGSSAAEEWEADDRHVEDERERHGTRHDDTPSSEGSRGGEPRSGRTSTRPRVAPRTAPNRRRARETHSRRPTIATAGRGSAPRLCRGPPHPTRTGA